MDITTTDTSEAGFKKQAEIYKGIMDACVKYSDSISAVVFWGTTDDKSWRASKYPLLFNEDYTAKDAFYAIVEGIDPPEYVPGDVDMNGSIEVSDLITVQKYLVKKTDLSEQKFKLADLNGDGAVNALSLIHI